MRIPLYQIDAFTGRLFGGNPAAVCPLTEWLPDATMQSIAAKMSDPEIRAVADYAFGLR